MASFPKISGYCRTQPEAILASAPIIAKRVPTVNDINYPLGTLWVNTITSNSYILGRVASNQATWAQISAAAGAVNTVTGNTGGALVPAAGNVNIVGDGTTISVAGAGSTLTVGLVASPVITGSLTVNGSITLPTAATKIVLPGPVDIKSGAGAPATGLALHVGDMYINTTAATAATRIYVATAVGAWTNVTCAA